MGLTKKRLEAAHSRQKNYEYRKRRELHFDVEDHVFLKISPSKCVMRFRGKGKLSPRYVGSFDTVERVGEVAYRVALPPHYVKLHDVFHISMLRKYILDETYVIKHDTPEIQADLSFEEKPMQIADFREHNIHNRVVSMVKVQWQHHGIEEATQELESEMCSKYPDLFGMSFIL